MSKIILGILRSTFSDKLFPYFVGNGSFSEWDCVVICTIGFIDSKMV